MNLLLRNVRIQDKNSPFNGQVSNILIENNIITKIQSDLASLNIDDIDLDGKSVSPGWVDIFSHFCDPGYEHKETLETGANAAHAGGYTHVFLIPNTLPAIHSKSQVEYIIEKSRSYPVQLHPIGTVTKNAEGKELAEMYDMNQYQAVAFSDGTHSIQSAGLLIKALQYVKAINGVIIQVPDDRSINPHGLMNEGIVSTRLGLPGKPNMAEEIMVARDIRLAQYTESRIHITGISTANSVDYIRQAKNQGIDVTCSVTPYHLFFSDEDLYTYDTNLKVNLPLRSKEDVDALRKGIIDGTIDCISTHHQPHEWDSKTCEFEHAKYGMIGLESCFGVLGALGIHEKKIIELISHSPRQIFNLDNASINIGANADLTIYDLNFEYTFEKNNIHSKSHNSGFLGRALKGKPFATFFKNKLHIIK